MKLDLSKLTVTSSKDPKFHLTTNAAFILAEQLKKAEIEKNENSKTK